MLFKAILLVLLLTMLVMTGISLLKRLGMLVICAVVWVYKNGVKNPFDDDSMLHKEYRDSVWSNRFWFFIDFLLALAIVLILLGVIR